MKCKICGKRFKLLAKNRYEIKHNPAPFQTLTEKPKIYEGFDCPKCGCQNLVNIREVEE